MKKSLIFIVFIFAMILLCNIKENNSKIIKNHILFYPLYSIIILNKN